MSERAMKDDDLTGPARGELIRNLCSVGYQLWRASLVAVPSAHTRLERMQKLCPGDIVFEITVGALSLKRGGDVGLAVGHLVEIKKEPYPGEWNEAEEGRPVPTEEVFYITRLDNGERVCWTNAMFVTIVPVGGW